MGSGNVFLYTTWPSCLEITNAKVIKTKEDQTHWGEWHANCQRRGWLFTFSTTNNVKQASFRLHL